jgi:D-tyrosyl-tRNA(Tyr) deacylase
MRALIQRVTKAKVQVENVTIGEIQKGLLILIGFHQDDKESDGQFLLQKIQNLRIFADETGKMNLSILDIQGEILIVSQFTLYAETRKGNRPSFIESAPFERAKEMYQDWIAMASNVFPNRLATGVFGADMQVELINDGPVTIMLDSRANQPLPTP